MVQFTWKILYNLFKIDSTNSQLILLNSKLVQNYLTFTLKFVFSTVEKYFFSLTKVTSKHITHPNNIQQLKINLAQYIKKEHFLLSQKEIKKKKTCKQTKISTLNLKLRENSDKPEISKIQPICQITKHFIKVSKILDRFSLILISCMLLPSYEFSPKSKPNHKHYVLFKAVKS